MMSEDKKLYLYTLNSKGTIMKEEYLVIEETENYIYYTRGEASTLMLMAPHIRKTHLDQPDKYFSYQMYSFSDKVSYAADMFAQFIKNERDVLLQKSEKMEQLINKLTNQCEEMKDKGDFYEPERD